MAIQELNLATLEKQNEILTRLPTGNNNSAYTLYAVSISKIGAHAPLELLNITGRGYISFLDVTVWAKHQNRSMIEIYIDDNLTFKTEVGYSNGDKNSNIKVTLNPITSPQTIPIIKRVLAPTYSRGESILFPMGYIPIYFNSSLRVVCESTFENASTSINFQGGIIE